VIDFLDHVGDGSACESLWRLLTAITLTRVREQIRFHRRQKRSIDQEVPLAAPATEDGEGGFDPVDRQPRRPGSGTSSSR
jgi:hypothetical protein